MRFLFDANLWFEILLQRQHASEVRRLLDAVPGRLIATTDLSIHAVGMFITKRNPAALEPFLTDLTEYEIGILHLPLTSYRQVIDAMQDYRLDFEDAVQYAAAERFALQIVSLDAHLKATPRQSLTPIEAMATV